MTRSLFNKQGGQLCIVDYSSGVPTWFLKNGKRVNDGSLLVVVSFDGDVATILVDGEVDDRVPCVWLEDATRIL